MEPAARSNEEKIVVRGTRGSFTTESTERTEKRLGGTYRRARGELREMSKGIQHREHGEHREGLFPYYLSAPAAVSAVH